MTVMTKRTVSLPKAHANYIDKKVRSGAYASASEVVRDGLRALQERDDAIERWLRGDVVKALEAHEADPGRAISADRVRAEIRTKFERRGKGAA